jgi:hydroxymethylpyrimidine pyrophosphatase-like HAD family hydrolase
MIVAVDFDGTIQLPDKTPNMVIVKLIKNHQRAGNRVILWTCREGESLRRALRYCSGLGLRFDAVNQNLPEAVRMMGHDSRKIYADIYIDDKAVK